MPYIQFQIIKIINRESWMNDLQRIFQNRIKLSLKDSKLPVACSINDVYEMQKELLLSSLSRKEAIIEKNKKVAEESLKYREQLNQKISLLQKKHDKRRNEVLAKAIKIQQRKGEYRKQIFVKHNKSEKEQLKERIRKFKERNEHMHQFWENRKLKSERSFRSQSAVKALYQDAVSRKKELERQNTDRGISVKSSLLRRHEGREDLVHGHHLKKQEEVHQVHKEIISKTLEKNKEIIDERVKSLINNIGDDFRKSQTVLNSNRKSHEKKLKDKLIDNEDHRQTIRSNFTDRDKQRYKSLSQCSCKKINNIEEALVKSITVKEELKHSLFGDTLKKLSRQPSQAFQRQSRFMSKSQSFRSSTNYNKETIRERKHQADTERLLREKEIAQAISLKNSIEVEGNCMIRKIIAQ